MSNNTGNNPHCPTRYLGPAVNFVPSVTRDRAPTGADYRMPETGKLYPIGTEWIVGKNPTSGTFGDIWFLSKIVANVAFWQNIGEDGQTITANDGTIIPPTNGNWNIFGQTNPSLTPPMQVVATNGSGSTLFIEDRTSTTPLVVDSSVTLGSRGTFSTIQAAVNAAVAGQTIFIKSGVYTEDINLIAGITLYAYGNGFTPTVTIIGNISLAATGVCTLYGLNLQTNGNYAISVTGSNSCRLYISQCNLNCSNFTFLNFSSSNAASRIRIVDSWCLTGTNSFNFFAVTGAGALTFWGVNVLTAVGQTIASTFASSGTLLVKNSILRFPITTSGTGNITCSESEFNTTASNVTALTVGGTAVASSNYTRITEFLSGNAVAITVSAGATLKMIGCSVLTTNSIPINGTGTVAQAGTSYTTSNPIPSTTGLTVITNAFDPGSQWGNWSGSAPAAGFLGEYIKSIVPFASALTINNGAFINVTSIVLTPGTWDVTGVVQFTNIPAGAGTAQEASVNNVSATLGNYGDNTVSATFNNTTVDDVGLIVPAYRVNVPVAGGNITMYLVASANYTGGTKTKAYGRISATRVA